MTTPILETKRLILRPITMEDAPAIQKYFSDWEVLKYTIAPWPFPDDGALTHIRDTTLPAVGAGQQIAWVITLKNHERPDEAIGRIDYRFNKQGADRGFWLAVPFQGQGLMTEVVMATLDYMFFDYGLEKIRVDNFINNKRSRRIKEKTGAIYIGTEEKTVRGEKVISEMWEMTKGGWVEFRKNNTYGSNAPSS